jgi:hypothetical protein
MSANESYLEKFPDGDNLEPHCFEFFYAGYLAAEELQFQIRLGLEKQIQEATLKYLRLKKDAERFDYLDRTGLLPLVEWKRSGDLRLAVDAAMEKKP